MARKTLKTLNPLVGKHTLIMGAVTKGLGDGRMKDFMTDMNDTTRDAIVNAINSNLTRLMNGKAPKSTKKVAKVEKAEKVAKKVKVAKTEKSDKTDKGADKNVRKLTKTVLEFSDAIVRIRSKVDDADELKKSVLRRFKKAGLETKSVNRNGSAIVLFNDEKYRVQFKNDGPRVSLV